MPRVLRKTVTFASRDDVEPTIARTDMTREELRESWYDRRELSKMVPDSKTLRKLEKSCVCGEECVRGLENYTKKGSKARQKVWLSAGMAVLDEQDFQREEGRADAMSIAAAYTERTHLHGQAAHIMGLVDAHYVKYHVFDFLRGPTDPSIMDKKLVKECEKLQGICQCHLVDDSDEESFKTASSGSSKKGVFGLLGKMKSSRVAVKTT